jgi:hypothetical protein
MLGIPNTAFEPVCLVLPTCIELHTMRAEPERSLQKTRLGPVVLPER